MAFKFSDGQENLSFLDPSAKGLAKLCQIVGLACDIIGPICFGLYACDTKNVMTFIPLS